MVARQNSNNFNPQVRSNSMKERSNDPNSRPSTAPSKNDIKGSVSGMSSNPISGMNNQKRLPSPNIKCMFLVDLANNYLSSSSNLGNVGLSNSGKYRSPSPMIMSTQNRGLGNINTQGSFKGFPSKMLK
jgi:hypothetical protein